MKIKSLITFFVIVLITISLNANDTVLAEVGDIVITTADLHMRINTFPYAARAQLRTKDGQKQLLEKMINEQLVYKKATEQGFDNLPKVQEAIINDAQPIVSRLFFDESYKRILNFNPSTIEIYYHEIDDPEASVPRLIIQHLPVNEDIDANDLLENPSDIVSIELDGEIRNEGPFEAETRIHFFRKTDFDMAIERPFSEIRDQVEAALIRQKREELYYNLVDELSVKYNVVADGDMLKNVGIGVYRLPGMHGGTRHLTLASITAPEELRDEIAVRSSNPDVQMTLLDVENVFRIAASRDILLNDFDTPEMRETVLLAELDRRIFQAAIDEENIYENNIDNYLIQKSRLETVVEYYIGEEIDNVLHTTESDLLEFYETHKYNNMVPEKRIVLQLLSNDLATARKHRREVARMIRRNQNDRIAEYMQRESILHFVNITIIDGIDVVPTAGRDDNYMEKVFAAKENELSDVFQNVNGYYVFFYMLEIQPSHPVPLIEDMNNYVEQLREYKINEIVDKMQTELNDEYNVVKYLDRIESAITPDELFFYAENAQNRGDFNVAIDLLDFIITDFYGTEYAYEALYLKGFLATDVLKDKDMARKALLDLINNYKETELDEAALFLLQGIQ